MHNAHNRISVTLRLVSNSFIFFASTPMQYNIINQNAEYPPLVENGSPNTPKKENKPTIIRNAFFAVFESMGNKKLFKTGMEKYNAKNAVKYQKLLSVTGIALLRISAMLQVSLMPAIVRISVTMKE